MYGSDKAQLGLTASQHTAWATAGLKEMALTSPVDVDDEYVWVALSANTASTLPTFAALTANAAVNSGLTAGDALWATADTSITTTMPASLGTFTAAAVPYLVALS